MKWTWVACTVLGCSAQDHSEIVDATSGFDVKVHGFGFPNYDNRGVENLTEQEILATFGEKACDTGPGQGCESLQPVYEELRNILNDAMRGGHCEGMATLAGLFFEKKLEPERFGASTVNALSFATPLLQREIAKYFSYQILEPTRSERKRWMTLGPSAIVAELERAFKQGGAAPMYTLAIYKRGFRGGHAITPFAVTRKGATASIRVYDNNFPNHERVLTVDTSRNVWTYQTSSLPGVGSASYEGDAETKTLGIVRAATRLQPQTCTECDAKVERLGEYGGGRRVWCTGGALPLVTNRLGQRLGYVNGAFVDEMPEGDNVPLATESLADIDDAAHFEVRDPEATIALDASEFRTSRDTSIVAMAEGAVLKATEYAMPPLSRTEVELGSDGRTLAMRPDHLANIELRTAMQFEGESWRVGILVTLDAGDSLSLGTDPSTSEIRLQNHADESRLLRLRASKAMASGRLEFSADVTLRAHEIVRFDFADWLANRTGMNARRDFEGDGIDDQTEMLLDDE